MKKVQRWVSTVLALTFLFATSNLVPVMAKTKKQIIVPKVVIVNQPKAEYTVGDRVIVKFSSPNYAGVVQYRAFLWSTTTKKFVQEIYKNYPGFYYKPVCTGKSVFTIDVFYPQQPGKYYIGILVKPKGAKTYSSYVYTKVFTVKPKSPVSTLTLDKEGTVYGEENKTKLMNIDKDVYIKADNITLKNANVNGTVYIDPGKDGSTILDNVTAKSLKVLSGGINSIHLNDVIADTLTVSSDNKTRVETSGTTKIGNTIVTSYTIFDANGVSLGTIRVTKGEGGAYTVELNGKFAEPVIVETGASIIAGKDTVVSSLQIATQNSSDAVSLQGHFDSVKVEKKADLHLESGTQIGLLTINDDVKINAEKTAKTDKVVVENGTPSVTGEGASNIPVNTPVVIGGGGIYIPSIINVTGISLGVSSAVIKVGDTINVGTIISPSTATNQEVTWSSSSSSASVTNGIVTGVSTGSAVITAKTKDGGFTAAINVVVTNENLTATVAQNNNNIAITLKNSVNTSDVVTIQITDKDGNQKYVEQPVLEGGTKVLVTRLDAGTYTMSIAGLHTQVINCPVIVH